MIKQAAKYFLITSIVLITVVKLNLMGTGFLAFPDEARYCQSGKALLHLSELKINMAVKDILLTQGRPVDAVIKIIPNAIQYITAYIFKLSHYESKNSYPIFIFNFIIYCFILIIHYKFSNFLLKDNFLALISVLLFSTLTNSYVYLRHALPYDVSLLILYLAIYKIAIYTEENSLSWKRSLVIGIGSFLGYLVYPGYFSLFMVGLFLLFFNNLSKKNIVKKIIYAGFYIFGGFLCLHLLEKVARRVGTSYILDAKVLSKTINQGSFEESFSYIVKYLIEVEGLTGIILLISLSGFFLIMLWQIKKQKFTQHSLINLLGVALLCMYIGYASAGYFFHKVVFYGRLLHQYFPFICIFSIYALNELFIKKANKKYLALGLISFIFVVNFGFNFIKYSSYVYPRDIFCQLIRENTGNSLNKFSGVVSDWPVMPKGSELKYAYIHGKPITLYYNIVAIEGHFTGIIYLVDNDNKQDISTLKDNDCSIESKPSFMNFKAYQYDSGATMIDRHNMDQMNLQIRVIHCCKKHDQLYPQEQARN